MVVIVKRLILCVLLGTLVTGCASVGSDFKYKNISQLKIGEDKALNYSKIFGKPQNTSKVVNSDGEFEEVRYLYASANMAVAQSRLLDLEFRNGVLNAYYHISSFDEDRTNVDNTKWSNIQKGSTNKEQLLSLLGEPHGKALYPSVHADYKDKFKNGKEIWSWSSMSKLSTFGSAYGGQKVSTKTIFVVFDDKGIVNEINTAESE